ncbi:MAG: cell division protein FtsQ/DivIB [Burkholderiaceae bacterium]
MNATAAFLALVAGGALLAIALLWVMRQPTFGIRAVHIDGDVARNSAATLRAHVRAGLTGNFFTLDLATARRALEEAPWVRHAVIYRLWPNRLAVHLEEHRAAALWGNDDDLLVNSHGEVFAANLGDVEDEDLPTLHGPDGSAPAMLALLQRLAPVLSSVKMRIRTLSLSGRGTWAMQLDAGASVELGRGSEAELVQRTEQFVRTVGGVIARYERPLLYADLRHDQGYAVRLKGISTVNETPSPAGRN